jgi:hypothetical protein
MRAYRTRFGGRSGGADMYDFANAFFGEGGSALFVSRLLGADAVVATADLGTDWLTVEAKSAGAWGNDVDVTAVFEDPGFTIQVVEDGELQEQSTVLADKAAIIAWGDARSALVTFSDNGVGAAPTADVTANLATGANGTAATDEEFEAHLDTLPFALGPGQVAAPGRTDTTSHEAIGRHIDTNKRVALIELPDSGDPATVRAAVEALYDLPGSRFMLPIEGRTTYPSDIPGATVEISWLGVQAGIIARLDALGDPSAVAAGSDGISRLAIGLTREWTDADRESLNESGVAMPKEVNGTVRMYGYRTAAGPDDRGNWTFFQESRTVMAIAHETNAAAEEFVLKNIDGAGLIFSRLNTALTGICARYHGANALYGAMPDEAFRVDTSFPGVNDDDTVALGEIHGTVYVKTSKVAEWVAIDVAKVPLERAV